jgi:hypothetical protein
MFLDDCVESFLILIRSHPYVRAGHPDFIAIGRLQSWIRHTEFVVLDFPGAGPFSADFVAEQDAVGPQITDPMGAIGNIPANDPGTDFLLAEQFEHFLRLCDRPASRRKQQDCERKNL